MPKSFARAIAITVFLGSLVAVAGCPGTAPAPPPPPAAPPSAPISPDFDDDDRPPIIVYNGTVQFKALPAKKDSGMWDPQGTTNGPWIHKHNHGGPQGFEVFIAGLKAPCTDQNGNTTNDFFFKKVEIISVAYDDNGATKTVTIKAVAKNGDRFMEVKADDAQQGIAASELLTFGLANASVTSIKLTMNGNKTATCNFGAFSLIVIAQKN